MSASTTAPLSIDDPALIPAMEANYRAFWSTLAASPMMKIEDRPEGMRYFTGHKNPVLNGFMGANLPADDAAVKAELDFFRERDLPVTWVVGPTDAPSDLGERLERLGAPQTSTNPGMIIDLEPLMAEDGPPGLEIREVEDEASFGVFSRILCEAFGMSQSREFTELFVAAGTGEDGSVASFLGLLNGEPVATSRTVISDGLAGVYTVATNEAARGKGLGRLLTQAACLYGKERGYKLGTLQSSDMGHPVYLKMGFRDLCEFRDYTWMG